MLCSAQMFRRRALSKWAPFYFVDALRKHKFLRDFGTHTEMIDLEGSAVKINMEDRLGAWQKELAELSDNFKMLCRSPQNTVGIESSVVVEYVAKKHLEMLTRVCREWKEIAQVTRSRVFDDTEQGEIDLFYVKCKEWGFLLKDIFGSSLGTGDYGHLLIDHAPMLMRRFLSMTEFSQQGFEASHKDQRQLWLKATSHDQHGEASSIEQMLVHFYAERMLFFRLSLQEALKSIHGKTLENQNTFQFYFSGCGWKAKSISWESSDILWIKLLDKLMFMMFGEDFFEYVFDEKRTCHVHDGFKPQFVYNRHEWNCEYENMISNSFGFTSKMQGDLKVFQQQKMPSKFSKAIQNQPEIAKGASHKNHALLVDEHLHQRPSNVAGKENTSTDQDRVIAVFPPPPAVAKIQVLQMDLATLKNGMEVNDSIVDFFLMYISQSLDQDLHDSIHVFSSFFYTKLSTRVQIGEIFVLPSPDERYVEASKFTRRVDIFKKKFIFIPVCRSGHWFLSVIYNLPTLTSRRRKDDGCAVVPILMIDSIVYGSDRKNFTCSPSSREQEANIIRSFIECESDG